MASRPDQENSTHRVRNTRAKVIADQNSKRATGYRPLELEPCSPWEASMIDIGGKLLRRSATCGPGRGPKHGVENIHVYASLPEGLMERELALADGRQLTYVDLGIGDGPPVLHMHGIPSGKLEAPFFHLDQAAALAGVRLLAIDRPGVGGSDPKRGRSLLDWPSDITEFADRLGLGKVAVLGYSMGAPSALACLHVLGPRLAGVAIVSGMSPPDVPGLTDGRSNEVNRIVWVTRSLPAVASLVLRLMRLGTRNPDRMLSAAAASLPPADRAVLNGDDSARRFAEFVADALRQGPSGVRDDLRLAVRSWGFTPTDSAVPVSIWHGARDRNVPVAAAIWLAERLPGASLTVDEDGGHLSVLASRAEEIFTSLR